MELTHLRYFLHVADSASFRRAADLAHVSPPAMTKAIHKLEEDVGARLFERTTRRVLLTEEGKAVARRAREVLRHVDALRQDVDELKTGVAGELRIGAMEVFSLRALPCALSEIVAKHPGIVPLSYEMHPEAIERNVAEGLLDVGFTIGSPFSKQIRSEILGTSKGCIVCGRGHPLYARRRIGPADLARYPFVVPRFFRAEHLPSLDQFPDGATPRLVGASIELLQMSVELAIGGRYLACFPHMSIEHHLASGALRALTGLQRLPRFQLRALTRMGVTARKSAALLVATLKSKLHRG